MMSKRRDCRSKTCTSVLHGDVQVYHRRLTPPPHISGNTMERMKKQIMTAFISCVDSFNSILVDTR